MKFTSEGCVLMMRRAGVAAVVGGLVCGLVAALWAVSASNPSDDAVVKATFTPILAVLVGTLLIINAAIIRRGRCVTMAKMTLAATIAMGCGWMVWIWGPQNIRHETFFLQLIGSASTLTIGIAIVCQLFAAEPRSAVVRAIVRVVAMCVACYALWIVMFVWSTWIQDRDILFGPPTVITGVLTLCLLLIVRVMLTWKSAAAKKETLANRPRLRMLCPRCEREQEHVPGAARCPRCRLFMLIDIQEPRCECGYLLYRLQGNTCPECGRIIEKESHPDAVHAGSET